MAENNKSNLPSSALYVFNIGNEVALPYANKASFTHSPLIQKMRQDLCLLPLWLSTEEEAHYTWMPKGAASDFDQLPLFPNSAKLVWEDEAIERHYGLPPLQIELWGIEPTLNTFFKKQQKLFPQGLALPISPNLEKLNQLFNRSLASQLLNEWEEYQELKTLICTSIQELEKALEILAQKSSSFVVKIPYSSSGRGIFLFSFPLNEKKKKQVEQLLLAHSCISLEAFLDKIEDRAFEYKINEYQEVSFIGLSSFKTQNFRYLYNLLASPQYLEEEMRSLIGAKTLEKIQERHIQFIQKHIAPYYQGVVGIDTLLYLNKEKKIEIHPAIEINTRKTMGYLAHCLFKKWGKEDLQYKVQIHPFAKENEALKYLEFLKKKHSPCFSSQEELIKGTIPLTLPTETSRFMATLECRLS